MFLVSRKAILIAGIFCLILFALAFSPPVRPYIKNRFLPVPLGTYSFRMYNSQAVRVADGELTILERETAQMISYERLLCHLRWRGFERDKGQTTMGSEEWKFDFTGILENGKVKFNLNPDSFDSNDILEGEFEGSSIRGKWFHSGWASYNPQGTFEAVRK
ncbi:MAG TPA: hypothetical protein VFD58_27350 [Blastocatellia bacterium]|nr:hypothetical protein [Blastocatellia bacterium]